MIERKRAEVALRASEERYRRVFNSMDEGYCLIEMMFDNKQQPVDWRYLEVNPSFEKQTGIHDITGKRIRELMPDHEEYWFETYGKVALTGEPVRFINEAKAMDRNWFDLYAFRVGGADSRKVAVLFTNITARKQTEEHTEMLSGLSRKLAGATEEAEIVQIAVETVGRYLNGHRCYFVECLADQNRLLVSHNWVRDDAPSIEGELSLFNFGGLDWWRQFASGDFSIEDVATHPLTRANSASYAAVGVPSYAVQPFRSEGDWTVCLVVTERSPRKWTAYDLRVLDDVVARVWPLVERARADRKLRESDLRYRNLFNSIDEGFCIIEMIFDEHERPVDYRYLEVNPTFERQCGLHDAVGKRIRELRPTIEDHWCETFGQVALTGKSVRFMNEAKSMEGRWWDVYALRVGEPESRRVAVIFNDITDRKQADEVRGRLAAIVESSGDAILSLNLNGVITSWNHGAQRCLGYTAAEAIGQPLSLIIPPGNFEEESDILEGIRRGERMHHYEAVRRCKDGTLLDVSVTVSPIVDVQGRVIGTSKIMYEITERKRAEAELEQRVADRTQELTQSHTQLTALATELNLAEQRERKRLAGELHDHLGQLLALGKMKLVQGMRVTLPEKERAALLAEINRVLTDAMTYMRTLVADLSPPILYERGLLSALRWLGDQMRRHELAVTVESDSDALQLAEDRAVLLFQSVRELLVNAVKHAKSPTATVRVAQESGTLRIEVQDQGAGFVPDALVEPGTMAAMTSKFGLFSIRERMKALGGRFELHSAPGQGTTATLTLPLGTTDERRLKTASTSKAIEQGRVVMKPGCDGAAPQVIHPQPSTSAPGGALARAGDRPGPIRVLLVDDHAMVRGGLRSLLESYADVEVVGEAGNGEEAVAAAESLQPSHVLMDIHMPHMNGIEATAQIKSRFPSMIVIGLSVQPDGFIEKAMKQAGAAMLLTKEGAVEELYPAIQSTWSGDAPSGCTLGSGKTM